VDTITDTQGTVVQRKAYTAYGKEITTDAFFPYSTKRGYTGHEHLDDSLIHMNGRVYDSTIGRFISADPNIFHPFDPQDFNRYAYVRNNPLKYTDPSGFEWGDEEGGDDWSGNDSNAGSQSDAQDTENNEAGGDNTNDYSGDGDDTLKNAAKINEQLTPVEMGIMPPLVFVAKLVTKLFNKSFFKGTKYSKQVKAKMKRDQLHNFPKEVEAFEISGKLTVFKGGDKQVYQKLEIKGNYRNRDGTFEFIKNKNNEITHRFFNPRNK